MSKKALKETQGIKARCRTVQCLNSLSIFFYFVETPNHQSLCSLIPTNIIEYRLIGHSCIGLLGTRASVCLIYSTCIGWVGGADMIDLVRNVIFISVKTQAQDNHPSQRRLRSSALFIHQMHNYSAARSSIPCMYDTRANCV